MITAICPGVSYPGCEGGRTPKPKAGAGTPAPVLPVLGYSRTHRERPHARTGGNYNCLYTPGTPGQKRKRKSCMAVLLSWGDSATPGQHGCDDDAPSDTTNPRMPSTTPTRDPDTDEDRDADDTDELDERRVTFLVRKWSIPRREARRLLEVQRHG